MFLDEISRLAKITKSIVREKTVKIFSHYDADGIISASILSKMFIREGINFQLRILKQLTKEFVDEIVVNKNDFLIFTDFGSGQINILKKFFDITQVLIIDHHQPINFHHINLFHLNPILFNDEEVPSSIISYLFAKFFDKRNIDLVDLAVVGAIADEHENDLEMKSFTKKVFDEAEAIGKLSITKGLRFYGRNRPIHKSLALSFDPFIPGISGSESQAVQFLSEINIPILNGSEVRTLKDLTLEEQQRLASAIISERMKLEENVEDIFGNIYTLIGKPEEIQDAREFGTLINACGRTGNFLVAFKLCLGEYSSLEECFEILDKYRKMISDALNLLKEEKEIVIETDYAKFIFGETKIPDTIIGTITSIIINSNLFGLEKPIFGFADTTNNMVKVSARAPKIMENLNLGNILRKAAQYVNGEAGGHIKAAGALIPKENQEKFIHIINTLLGEAFGDKKG